eukprot:TRINITY_DN526_c0_g1_i2.p1 TRINITY_DN526_c0_g1~~TRINITY_DN526_c0_g1_i2.p1  ORF type:complete len:508 (-),score=228.34 TRINITY_DN526_c0_g1_i2:81-1604(-)
MSGKKRTNEATSSMTIESKISKKGKAEKRPSDRDADDDSMCDSEDEDNLHFEDPFCDEIEEEDIIDSNDQFEEDDETQEVHLSTSGTLPVSMEDDEEDKDSQQKKKVFRPGVDQLEPGEVLDYDRSVYDMMFALNVEWPCLSFDFMRDPLGVKRTKFPHTMYTVAGTQTAGTVSNKLVVMKLSQLNKTKHDDDSEEESDDELEDDPIVEHKFVNHRGAVNRIRSMPQNSHIVANWSETGEVHIWDLMSLMKGFDGKDQQRPPKGPMCTLTAHKKEGYAIDWSPIIEGRLATGDNANDIHVWNMESGGKWTSEGGNSSPYVGHTGSVEDLQWSPVEQNVFASCSSDRTIKIWDTRSKERSMISVLAHDDDVNVISWNKAVSYLLVSGCEDGSFKIWDLRKFQADKVAAHFKWHTGPITSVEWHPTDSSLLAASSSNLLTIWDLSLEKDVEAEEETGQVEDPNESVPPQLLFVHQGLEEAKELHWHPQIPGAIVCTAANGFHIFKTFNV